MPDSMYLIQTPALITDTNRTAEYPPHLSRGQFQEFMQDYVDQFDLNKYIVFNTSVKFVQRNEDDTKWAVQIEGVESGETETRHFDKIVFCHGYQTEKKMPHFQGQETYEGEIVHSQQYRRSVSAAETKPYTLLFEIYQRP